MWFGREEGEDGCPAAHATLASAASAALRQAATLAVSPEPGRALAQLASLTEAAHRISDCLDPEREPALLSERDALDFARARAMILLNKLALTQAWNADPAPHQNVGSTG